MSTAYSSAKPLKLLTDPSEDDDFHASMSLHGASIEGPQFESKSRYGEHDNQFMRDFRTMYLRRRGYGRPNAHLSTRQAEKAMLSALPTHLSPLQRKIAAVDCEFEYLESLLQEKMTWDQMCQQRWEWLNKLHNLIQESGRPDRPATAIVLESMAPPQVNLASFISILTNAYRMDAVRADPVLRELFKCFLISTPQDAFGDEIKDAVIPPNPVIDLRELVCCLQILENPTTDAKSHMLCLFDVFDEDSSHVIPLRHCLTIVMVGAISDPERRATGKALADALLEHAHRWGLNRQYRTVSDALFLEILDSHPDIIDSVQEQVWRRFPPDYRASVVAQRGDEIFARFARQVEQRQACAAQDAWKTNTIKSTYAIWVQFTKNQKAIKKALHRSLVRASVSCISFWRVYARERHRFRAHNELAKIEGRRRKKQWFLRKWRLWKDREVRIRRVLWLTSLERYHISDGLRKVNDVYMRLCVKGRFHAWRGIALEEALVDDVVAYMAARRRARAFRWWARYAHDVLELKRTEWAAEQRRQLMLKEWGEFEVELEKKRIAEEEERKRQEEEARKLEAERKGAAQAWSKQRDKAERMAIDRKKLAAQLEEKRERRRQVMAARQEKFNTKWDEIEAAGVEETSSKWEEWLGTKDGHALCELHARRLKKAMEIPPQDQSVQLKELLHSPAGAGQVGSKWKLFEHPIEGVLCYENLETKEVIMDYQMIWSKYKEIAHDNYVAQKVQEALHEIHDARKADQEAWDQDYAARVLQQMWREHKAHKELNKQRWKVKLQWLHKEQDQERQVAVMLQSIWRARRTRAKFLQIVAQNFEERSDPSTGHPYWVDKRTGESMWEKPSVLRMAEHYQVVKMKY